MRHLPPLPWIHLRHVTDGWKNGIPSTAQPDHLPSTFVCLSDNHALGPYARAHIDICPHLLRPGVNKGTWKAHSRSAWAGLLPHSGLITTKRSEFLPHLVGEHVRIQERIRGRSPMRVSGLVCGRYLLLSSSTAWKPATPGPSSQTLSRLPFASDRGAQWCGVIIQVLETGCREAIVGISKSS